MIATLLNGSSGSLLEIVYPWPCTLTHSIKMEIRPITPIVFELDISTQKYYGASYHFIAIYVV